MPSPASERNSVPGGVSQMNAQSPPPAVRHHLPDERPSITHTFIIAGHQGYITVGLYPDHQPGEIFVIMAKEGSTLAGMMDCFAISISLALQHGVPLKLLCDKFSHTRFEPSGWTQQPDLGYAKSIMDYIFRWLNLRFIDGRQSIVFNAGEQEVSTLGEEHSCSRDAQRCRRFQSGADRRKEQI
jgi:ribonucleoside-diphosphate reductase alpha chain